LQTAEVEGTEELRTELTMIAKERPDALFVYPDVILSSYPRPSRLAEFALKAHLPMMNAFRFSVDAGGLTPASAPATPESNRGAVLKWGSDCDVVIFADDIDVPVGCMRDDIDLRVANE
jgi:hypothetical protein